MSMTVSTSWHSATAMRRILVSHARERRAQRRGGQYTHVEIRDDDAKQSQNTYILALDQALDKLAQIAPRQHRIVEMRFFGGLTLQEMATHLNLSTAMVSKDLATAKAWLLTRLDAH